MEQKKIRLLIIGITMQPAGTENSFLSFASCLDYDRYDVTLLLAKKEGLFLPMIPKQIRVITMEEYADMFTMDGGNAMRVIWSSMVKRNPRVLLDIFPFALKIALRIGRRADQAMRMWCRLEKRFPDLPGEYDIALAYWGDKTMFYMLDHVCARRKIAWLHFDYMKPARDDSLYGPAFEACDSIVTVSRPIEASMRGHFPSLGDKIVCMENICDPRQIRELALRGDTFPDAFYEGTRILTVGRIAEQKGYDMAVAVLARLREEGYCVRWYIVGSGTEEDERALKLSAVERGVADALILLGNMANPYTYMRDCDIYVQPSRHEGKPIAVEEAKILYKPILVTDYLSAREQLEDGHLGAVCEISEDGIYRALKSMLDDPACCETYTGRLMQWSGGSTEAMAVFEGLVADLCAHI